MITSCLTTSAGPIAFLRDYRDAWWWLTWQAWCHEAKRRKLVGAQSKTWAKQTAWEGPFLVAWGHEWKHRLRHSGDYIRWQETFGEFFRCLLSKWLPESQTKWDIDPRGARSRINDKVQPSPKAEQKAKKKRNTRGVPRTLIPFSDHLGDHIAIYTDSQVAVNAIHGRSPNSTLPEETLRNLGTLLLELIRQNWKPKLPAEYLVQWVRRKEVEVADEVATLCSTQDGGMVGHARITMYRTLETTNGKQTIANHD